MPPGSGVLVVTASGGWIVTENCLDAVWLVGVEESVTVTVTVYEAAVLGVPEIAPVLGFRVSPAGSPLADHVNGDTPPVAVACWL
jgi:hypothetical protein